MDQHDLAVRRWFDRLSRADGDERRCLREILADQDHAVLAEVDELLDCAAGDAALDRPPTSFVALASNGAPAGAPLDEDVLPRIAGHRIVRSLGAGGMGDVYLAEEPPPMRRMVAVKVIKLGMDTRELVARFRHECRALALLAHPNVSTVHSAGSTEDGRPFFAMEHVDGVPLLHHCDERRLDVEARIRLFLGVCDGVQHAHERGVVHRDIKPSNVLVTMTSGAAVPKLIDFGIAKVVRGSAERDATMTVAGALLGTPEYMSPEQLSLDCELDARCDVYALGVVLYQLLSGVLPVQPRGRGLERWPEIRRILAEGDAPLMSAGHARALDRAAIAQVRRAAERQLTRRLRGDLDWIVAKAIARERSRRYASAAALAADLQRYLRKDPIDAGPPSALNRAARFARRNRPWLVFVGALAIGLVASTWMGFEARAARRVADQRGEQLRPFTDLGRLATLIEEHARLGPPREEIVHALDAWLARARELSESLPGYRDLAALAAASTVADRRPAPDDEHLDAAVYRDAVARLIVDLERLTEEGGGLIRDVELLRARSASIRVRTIDAWCDSWNEAIASIARSPAYGGLRIAPQLGLIPLGADRESGLWEFAAWCSGETPRRDARGEIVKSPDMAIVLVLVPGATFTMGAERVEHADVRSDELPTHVVALDPFFLSKHEVTQGQWTALTGVNPSRCRAGACLWGIVECGPLHPVYDVTWSEARDGLRRIDLDLPTEAQWEYAARASTPWPWWTGAAEETLSLSENLADLTLEQVAPIKQPIDRRIFDGFAGPAAVGSLRANPFGLHDVLGNVWEWCRDDYLAYDYPNAPGDGLRLGPSNGEKVVRSGAWDAMGVQARSTRRFNAESDLRRHKFGVRAARRLDR